MNRQLQRDLQTNIQTLKAAEISNMLKWFERNSNKEVDIKINSKCDHIAGKGMNHECEMILEKKYKSRGFGRNQSEAVCNGTKNLFSTLIGENVYIEPIKQSLKYRNISEGLSHNGDNKNSFFQIDDISVIKAQENLQLEDYECQKQMIKYDRPTEQESSHQKKSIKCDCIFFQRDKYHLSQIKHLQARINLLTDENNLLKKVLLHNRDHHNDKQNSQCLSNSGLKIIDQKQEQSSYLLFQDYSNFSIKQQ